MRKTLHSGVSRLLMLIYALALSGILPACTDDADRELPDSGKGRTVTLELSLSVPPMLETKAVICEADSASEARKAGFYYEMQVQTTDTTGNAGGHVATKAASSLKNIYAFLFKKNGTFNGRASIEGEVDINKSLLLKFEGVTSTTESNGRLVIIANDAAAATNYVSDPTFATFSDTYTIFQNIQLKSDITKDEDIPYVGSTTVGLDDGTFTLSDAVPLYRMLAKIVLYNEIFDIVGGPARDSINLHYAGNKYFGTPNGYDGVGNTLTTAERYSTTATVGKNENTNTWYVGENVQTTDSTKAAYIELGTEVGDISNTTPKVGEEYIPSGSAAFKYKVYLKDYALRRNNVYTVRVNVSGDLAFHQALASTEGSNVSKESTVVLHGGLNIGMYGGAEGYTSGSGEPPTISGTYTKYLLLQPNTSGTTDPDPNTEKKNWSSSIAITYQPDTRKYWDPTYTLANGPSDKGSDYAYDYCNKLTIGNVPEGTWYLPTQMQLYAIYGIWGGIKKKNSSYAYYSAFDADNYWSATNRLETHAWGVNFSNGYVSSLYKTIGNYVRCVRDLPLPILSTQTVTIDSEGHPVIDLSALQPLGAVLSFAEASDRRTEMKITPYNSTFLSVGEAVSGHTGTWNAQMSGKFQVMCADHTDGTMNWATAYNACKSYNGEGSSVEGEWRLPTQRELAQIMILHPQLISKGNFKALTTKAAYWSLTEYAARGAWYLNTTTGQMDYGGSNKTILRSARCIRDVE